MDDYHLNYITKLKKSPCNQSNARQTDGFIKREAMCNKVGIDVW
jgi:hypothetical protein